MPAQAPAAIAAVMPGTTSKGMPAALIGNASHAEQRVVVATVADLVHAADAHAIQAPAIMVIGSVATVATVATVAKGQEPLSPAAAVASMRRSG